MGIVGESNIMHPCGRCEGDCRWPDLDPFLPLTNVRFEADDLGTTGDG